MLSDWILEEVFCRASKLLIRLGKTQFLGSGKATTRSKRRITAALRVLSHSYRNPTRVIE
jgi:hypothetical protein